MYAILKPKLPNFTRIVAQHPLKLQRVSKKYSLRNEILVTPLPPQMVSVWKKQKIDTPSQAGFVTKDSEGLLILIQRLTVWKWNSRYDTVIKVDNVKIGFEENIFRFERD